MTSISPQQLRQQLRQHGIAARLAMPDHDWQHANQQLNHHLSDWLTQHPQLHHIGFCWPYRREPDLREAIRTWLEQHPAHQAALPIVPAEAGPLTFRQWAPDSEMDTDRYGIASPRHGADITPQLLLIPVNAFDPRGYRIGYGAGFFDRTLATLQPRPLTLGIGFSLAKVPDTYPQTHDIPLDGILTERGLHG